MNNQDDHASLAAILSEIGSAICEPLDEFRDVLVRIVHESDGPDRSKRQAHASTMLTLCDELGILTRETFETETLG